MANGDPTGEPSTADFKAVTTFELAKCVTLSQALFY
jgi:hypothetical protein